MCFLSAESLSMLVQTHSEGDVRAGHPAGAAERHGDGERECVGE